MRVRSLLLGLAAVALPLTVAVAQDTEGSLWPDLGGREVTIAFDNLYPPYNYIDETSGEGVGWDYDTFREICRRLNCEAVFIETSWEGTLTALSNGEFDIAAGGITYTIERDETVDFSQLFQAYDEALLVREGEDRFTNAESLLALGDFAVSSQVGTTNAISAVNLFGEENVQQLDNFGLAVQALINNDVDAVVIDRPAGEGYLETTPGLTILEEPLPTGIQGLAFAFPPDSELVPAINAAMSAMIYDGTWDEIYATWFESES